MTPVDVTLTNKEMWIASTAGAMRQIISVDKGLRHGYGMEDTGWTQHIEGAGGEVAVAKHANVYFEPTVGTFKKQPDVYLWDVRTRSKHSYDALIRPDDIDGRANIHVTGEMPNYKIWGWIMTEDARQSQFVQTYGNRPPAFFVPVAFLHPLETLPGWLQRR